MNERLPDHSSLTRIRQRWGELRFRAIFTRIVQDCQRAGLVSGEVVHVDASLIRADVSFDSLVARHLDAVETANGDAPAQDGSDRLARRTGKFKKLCATDPDATMATSSAGRHLQPSYKQHTAVDDHSGIVVDVEIVTGEAHDARYLEAQLDQIEATLGAAPGTVTADKAYGIGRLFEALEARGIDPVIPPLPTGRRAYAKSFPVERFRYDAHHDIVRCPRERVLTPRSSTKSGRWFRPAARSCADCPLRSRCISNGAATRRVHITTHFVATLRARRRRRAWTDREETLYARHRWQVEGVHGTAKSLHGLKRAIRRGIENMKIQALRLPWREIVWQQPP